MSSRPSTDAVQAAPAPRSANADPVPPGRARAGINWLRFWLQMLAAMMVFNIIAGLVTWFFIFPHLHAAR